MKPEELLHLFSPYLPTDRFRALLRGSDLPTTSEGAALLVDISGFTPMTTQFVVEYGAERASEELKRRLNPMFEAIAGQVFQHGGSVIRFTGDGFIAWFDDQQSPPDAQAAPIGAALRALAAGLEMQALMPLFRGLKLKVCTGTGTAFRWVVGQRQHGLIDVLLGPAVEQMARLSLEAQPGQVLLHQDSLSALEDAALTFEQVSAGSVDVTAIPDALAKAARRYRWPAWAVEGNIEDTLNAVRPFVDSAIRERVESGFGDYVGELRYAIPAFIQINSVPPEQDDARDALDYQVRSVQSVLASFGGRFVSAEVGDKGSVLLGVFGAPISYGDDAERAVRAAMALRDMSAEPDGLQVVRVGLSRGLLYAGTLGGEVRHEYTTVGEETNVASRLMSAAKTHQVLTTSKVRSEVGPRIVFEDLPDISVKGLPEPIPVSEPKVILAGSQQQAHVGELVGREKELNQLHKLANASFKGYPRIARVVGQAGIGKSRLVAELVRLATAQGFRAAGGDCVSTGRNVAYLPWRDILFSLLGLSLDAPSAENLAQLYRFVVETNVDWLPRLPLFGDILELPIADTPVTVTLQGRLRQNALFALVTDVLIHLSRRQPLFLIIEDTHWIDEVSEALVIELARRLAVEPSKILVLLVHRPLIEADHPQAIIRELAGMHLSMVIQISELSRSAVTEMIEKYLDASIPPELSHFVYERARGNPFFIQEVVDTLLETGYIKVVGSIVFIENDLQTADLPSTVQKLVQARIDRLNETEKLVLKVAAVIGQEFQVNVLARSIPIPMQYDELLEHLRVLEERDFSYHETPEQELTYLFKHAITQEVTYQSLLFAQRRQLHQAVASALEVLAPDATERLAYHFARSGDDERARRYITLAAERAYKDYANQSALGYFHQALDLARDDVERFEINQRCIEIMLRLGDMRTVQEELPALQELATRYERPDWQAIIFVFWADYYTQTSAWGKVIESAQKAITYSIQAGEDNLAWEGYMLLRNAFLALNQPEEADSLIPTMQVIADKTARLEYQVRLTLFIVGDVYQENLADTIQAAINQARELHSPVLEADGWATLAKWHSRRNNLPAALAAYTEQIALLRQIGDRRQEGLTLLNMGNTLVSLGALSEGNSYLLDAYKILHNIGERAGEAGSLVGLGTIAYYHQAYDEALAYMRRGLAIQRTLDTETDAARTLFHIGNVYIMQNLPDDAAGAFKEAHALFVAHAVERNTEETAAALAELALISGELQAAQKQIEPLMARLLEQDITDLILPGLAYWRTIQVLQTVGDEETAAALRDAFGSVTASTLNSLDAAGREAFSGKIWFHAALTDSFSG